MGIVGDQSGLYDPNMMGSSVPDTPLAFSVAESLPGVVTMASWNMARSANTITGGGTVNSFGRRVARRMTGRTLDYADTGLAGRFRGGIFNTLGPRHARKFTRPANIDPTNAIGGDKIYSPFNFLASQGNKRLNGKYGKKILDKFPKKYNHVLLGSEPIKDGEQFFSPGTLGRINAGQRIAGMSNQKFMKSASTIKRSIADINPSMGGHLADIGNLADATEFNKFAYKSGLGETVTGRISGRLTGYIHGAEAVMKGSEALAGARVGISNATSHYAQGFDIAARNAAAGGKIAKFVGSGAVSGALRGASAASWVMLAHDVFEAGGKLIGAGINTAFDAATSLKGSLDKPVMGMGFKDNAVASTSRQRGVMAIQNSRLNARSALGSEAGYMAQHFG